jgi:uncharacterized protein YciI
MFLVSLSYKVDLDEIDKILPRHVKYLKAQYKQGSFITSGRKIPRTGGIILFKLNTLEELQKVLEQDPFKIHNLANYEIQEFIPSMTSDEFKNLLE